MESPKDLKSKALQKIKSVRRQKRITQQEMADLLCVSRTAYLDLENGKNQRFDIDDFHKICEKLEISLSDVLDDKPKFDMILDMIEFISREKLIKPIPYDELTVEQLLELGRVGFNSRESYEDTPFEGRIFYFGPNDIPKFMFQTLCLDWLVDYGLIKSDYWLEKYEDYKKSLNKEEEDKIQIDTKNYVVMYLYDIEMKDGSTESIELAPKNIPQGIDEEDYIRQKTGAIKIEPLAFTFDEYCEEEIFGKRLC